MPVTSPAVIDTAAGRLSDVPRDERVAIVGIDDRCEGFARRRLLDLGFTTGTSVVPALDTFAGDPRGYLIRGTLIALRREQAALILVEPRDAAYPADGDDVAAGSESR